KTGEAGIGVGIDKQQAEEGLQVDQTPNTISVSSINEPKFNVLITDFLGRKLYAKENVVNEIVIDKDLIDSDAYLVVVSFPALQEAKKVFRLANN
nr:hypothetical protein [Chitinophagales bacterium]